MHKDFHLYGTYLAARLANIGDADAKKIAFAAQAVDDYNSGDYQSCQGDTDMATTFLASGKNKMVNIWVPFHFLPANVGVPTLSLNDQFKTAPTGELYNKLPQWLGRRAEDTTDAWLAKCGVIAHVFADTYAHDDFSGLPDTENAVENAKILLPGGGTRTLGLIHSDTRHVPVAIFSSSGPKCLGHGTIGHLPDISWISYDYSTKKDPNRILLRTNPELFIKAFLMLTKLFSQAYGTVSADAKVITDCLSEVLTDVQINFESIKTGSVSISESDDMVFETLMNKPITEVCAITGANTASAILTNEYKCYKDALPDVFKDAVNWHRTNITTAIKQYYPNFPKLY